MRDDFTRLFMKVTLVMAVIILLLALSLYYNFRSYMLDQVTQSNEALMNHVFASALQNNAYFENFAVSLFNDPLVQELMQDDGQSHSKTLTAVASLGRSLSGRAPFLLSTTVYNGKTESFYTIGSNHTIRGIDRFDGELVRLLLDDGPIRSLNPIPRQIPHSESEPDRLVNVYTFLLPKYAAKGEELTGALALNVKADWLFNTLFSYKENRAADQASNIMVLDSTGTVIGHSLNRYFMENVTDQAWVERISGSGHDAGYFVADVDGEPSVVTYASYSSPEWTMISITPYESVAAAVDKVKAITSAIGLSVFALCIVPIYLLAKNLYEPVQRLSSTMKSLVSFQEDYHSRIKQSCLRDILEGNVQDLDGFQKLFHDIRIRIRPDAPLAIALLRIDRYESFCAAYGEADRIQIRQKIAETAEKRLGEAYACDTADLGENGVAVILNAPASPAESDIGPAVRDIQQAVMREHGLSVTVAVSRTGDNLESVPVLYQELQEAAKHRLISGHGSVIYQTELPDYPPMDLTATNDNLNELLQAVKLAKEEEVERQFARLGDSLCGYPYNTVIFILSYLTAGIADIVKSIERNSTATFHTDFVDLDRRIRSAETLEEMLAEYRRLFAHMMGTLRKNKAEKQETIVLTVMKYIHGHYQDPGLSLQSVADRFNLSPGYLNKQFRDHTSMSVSDFITDVRLTEAKKLLQSGSISVEDILERIGWENKKYFYTVFKKHNGVTPGQFRIASKVKALRGNSQDA